MNKENLLKQLHRFRMIALAEGVSFLILLLIAMPLKYLFDIPQAVRIFGWVHGALFIGYIYFTFGVFTSFKKDFIWLAKAFLASVFPFGTFILDRELKMEEQILMRSK
jgi:integral membrane protein